MLNEVRLATTFNKAMLYDPADFFEDIGDDLAFRFISKVCSDSLDELNRG